MKPKHKTIRFAPAREGWNGRAREAAIKVAAKGRPFDGGDVRAGMGNWNDGLSGSAKAVTLVLNGLVKEGKLVEIADGAGPLWVAPEGVERLSGDGRYRIWRFSESQGE